MSETTRPTGDRSQTELAVEMADEWLSSHRKNETWRVVDMVRDELVRTAGRLAEAEEWADGQSYPLIMRQGETLTGVANALNGPTPPLTSWSHHDLAEKAQALVKRAERAEARIEKVEALLDRVSAESGVLERRLLGGHAIYPEEVRRALDGGEGRPT